MWLQNFVISKIILLASIVIIVKVHVYKYFYSKGVVNSCVYVDVCIGCGSVNVVTEHPLFHGGLCKHCKVTIAYMLFQYFYFAIGQLFGVCVPF